MPNRTEACPAKAELTTATGRLPLLRLFSTPLKTLIRTRILPEKSMGIFKEIHELRVVDSPAASRELRRKLEIAISRGWIEQISVMKPHPMSSNETWYRDNETGQIL